MADHRPGWVDLRHSIWQRWLEEPEAHGQNKSECQRDHQSCSRADLASEWDRILHVDAGFLVGSYRLRDLTDSTAV